MVGFTLPYASAQYVHPRGILIFMSDQSITLLYNGPGEYSADLFLVIMPPWYFADVSTFDTVTLTLRLVTQESISCCYPNTPRTPIDAPTLLTDTLQWSNVHLSQDENGATVGGVLYGTVTFLITGNTRPGYYFLYMNAQATSAGAIFLGFDYVAVGVSPG